MPSPSPTPTVRGSDIVDFKLESFTVSAGTTVVWTNRDNDPHTTTSGVPAELDGLWNSSTLSKNDRFSFTFTQPGVFPYWCRVHPNMTGTITVLPPATTYAATPITASDFEPGSLRFAFTRGWGSEGSDDGQLLVHPTGPLVLSNPTPRVRYRGERNWVAQRPRRDEFRQFLESPWKESGQPARHSSRGSKSSP